VLMAAWLGSGLVIVMRYFCVFLWLCSLPGLGGEKKTAVERFGFTGPEIFPIEEQVEALRAADLNGDGLTDLVVANNRRSKITILYNRTGRKVTPKATREVNELPPDARFRIDSIAAERRIAALEVADLNGDGRPDIAYFGEPKELLVRFNEKDGWSEAKRWTLEDGKAGSNSLVTGDLNGDGRTDLLALGESGLYVLRQGPKGLAKPKLIPFSGAVRAFQVVDLDGDKRNDLLLIDWESPNPFRFRLQNAHGGLGPEVHFRLPSMRSFWAEDLDGDQRAEVITIARQSGRAQVHHLARRAAEMLSGTLKRGQLEIMPLRRTDKEKRGVTWADVDGDGRTDLLTAQPESSELTIRQQQADGTLGTARTFPSLSGISAVAAADWDGDGSPEIFVLSEDEKQVGVTRLAKNGRLPFPNVLAVDGHPLAMAAGVLSAKAKPVLALVLDRDGKRFLHIQKADGTAHSQELDKKFKANPSVLAFHDADQDGQMDLLVMAAYEKVKVLRQKKGDNFEEIDLAPPGGTIEKPAHIAADVDGDGKLELLLARQNFLRAATMVTNKPKGDWAFRVKEQINGTTATSRITGAVQLGDALVLLDAARKELTLCERDDTNVWQASQSLRLPVADFKTMTPLALGSAKANGVALTNANAAAWLIFGRKTLELKTLDSYESPIKEGVLQDVVCGDLSGNGRKDLIFFETKEHHIDLVAFDAPGKLLPGNRWRVFEQRTFRNARGGVEPREGLVSDFNGDKKKDLAVLVHDRILLYLGE